MKKSALFLPIGAALLVNIGSASSEGILDEMQTFSRTYDSTWNEQGAAETAKYLATDVVLITASGAVIRGRDNVARLLADHYPKGASTHTSTVQGAHQTEDGAWAYGETTVSGNPASHARWAEYVVKNSDQWSIQLAAVTNIAK
jgi:ketosteroid isomerase-like protein